MHSLERELCSYDAMSKEDAYHLNDQVIALEAEYQSSLSVDRSQLVEKSSYAELQVMLSQSRIEADTLRSELHLRQSVEALKQSQESEQYHHHHHFYYHLGDATPETPTSHSAPAQRDIDIAFPPTPPESVQRGGQLTPVNRRSKLYQMHSPLSSPIGALDLTPCPLHRYKSSPMMISTDDSEESTSSSADDFISPAELKRQRLRRSASLDYDYTMGESWEPPQVVAILEPPTPVSYIHPPLVAPRTTLSTLVDLTEAASARRNRTITAESAASTALLKASADIRRLSSSSSPSHHRKSSSKQSPSNTSKVLSLISHSLGVSPAPQRQPKPTNIGSYNEYEDVNILALDLNQYLLSDALL